ncbi:hypothetical protein D3C73_730500 [compost metagenome]
MQEGLVQAEQFSVININAPAVCQDVVEIDVEASPLIADRVQIDSIRRHFEIERFHFLLVYIHPHE